MIFAFTLVELLVCIVMIGILAAGAIAVFSGSL
ncbi:MAG: prepilin-type N-terminal cleavage/methylation domain-containing protein [Bacteroidetes Order II. Incertae sedis bacterium]|nr:prepilin-type N-terminal cleavage/methylation domain-containing protein [Bacteroidetes Order II. bacterium]